MDTSSTYLLEDTKHMSGRDEEEEDEKEMESGDKDDGEEKYETKESGIQTLHRPDWAPCFFYKADKDVYHYAGQKIVIEEALDSRAGTTSPEALALCHYLDTHREQMNLEDKAVLEIGAGSGLVSVVASLLGAWVTATDLPEVLSSLRANLSRNTRGRCRHTPQVAALSWDCNLERSYPTSVYRYDYVLAADVVYHHDKRLLATMKHFCQPGTTVIWADKIRLESDLTFAESFKEAFHSSLLAEDGDTRIFMATCKDGAAVEDPPREGEGGRKYEVEEHLNQEGPHCVSEEISRGKGNDNDLTKEHHILDVGRRDEAEKITDVTNKSENSDSYWSASDKDVPGQGAVKQTATQVEQTPAWVPSIICSLGKDVYHYVGQDIVIYESFDSYGAVMWPAALALCSFLDNNREMVNLQGKKVLELGAGTGLVAIVASLLGAAVTATDLPETLSNLRANVMRNTRGRCRHLPQVAALPWGFDLGHSFPTSIYQFDYVLAADVVYHHKFLDELLATMKHFCGPGTTVIWANKVRLESDLTFTENFKKTFLTSLLAEDGDMKIFMATCKGRST